MGWDKLLEKVCDDVEGDEDAHGDLEGTRVREAPGGKR